MNPEWGENKTRRAWLRLWRATRGDEPHEVDTAALGEYAALLRTDGQTAASTYPEIHRHVTAGCGQCEADLDAFAAHFAEEEAEPSLSEERWLAALLAHAWTYSDQSTAAFQVSEYPELTLQAVQTGRDTELHLAERVRVQPTRTQVEGWGARATRADGVQLFTGTTDSRGTVQLPGLTVRDVMRATLELQPPRN